jgi:hypothetical protein
VAAMGARAGCLTVRAAMPAPTSGDHALGRCSWPNHRPFCTAVVPIGCRSACRHSADGAPLPL